MQIHGHRLYSNVSQTPGGRREVTMSERDELIQELMNAVGEEGCGVSCEEATVYRDEEGWKMMLEGFMEPWKLGTTVKEAKARIREYAGMGFGLS